MEVSVLVADPQRLYGEALAVALGAQPGLLALPEHPQDSESTVAAARRLRPDVVLVDHWIGGRLEGPGVAWELRSDLPGVKVILMSWLVTAAQVDAALGAGAAGFLPKSIGVAEVTQAVRQARFGESPVFGAQLRRLVDTIESRNDEVEERSLRFATLSQRELELLGLLERGLSRQKLAAELFINEGTLRNHIHSILKKTGARNQQELARMARKGTVQLAGSGPPAGSWRPAAAGEEGDVRVLVADEQRLFAESLGWALAGSPGIAVVSAEYGSGGAAVQTAIRTSPNVILYDYWMPETTGVAAARYLRTWAASSPIILSSWLHGPREVANALSAGAAAMVRKSIALGELIEALKQAPSTGVPDIADTPSAEPAARPEARADWMILRTLTPRELEVLHLLCQGRSRVELAEELGISEATARNHLNSILRKTRTESGLEAVAFARREGLVREPGAPPLA